MMKQIYEPNRIVLIGKGYQIQAALNGIAKSSYGRQSVIDYTSTKPAMHITLGNSLSIEKRFD